MSWIQLKQGLVRTKETPISLPTTLTHDTHRSATVSCPAGQQRREEVFNEMAPSVHLGVAGDWIFAIRLGRDDREGAAFLEWRAQGVVVELHVAEKGVEIDSRYERLDTNDSIRE